MKGTLSEVIWAVLHSIAPLNTSSDDDHPPSRVELLKQVDAMMGSVEGAAERASAIAEMSKAGNVFPVSFLADGTAPYVYLHCSLTILNRGVVVLPYHFLMSLLRVVFGIRILIPFVSVRYINDACMRTGGRVTTPSLS